MRRGLNMEKDEQKGVEGVVLAHELTEQGTRLVVLVGDMESVPRKIKIYW